MTLAGLYLQIDFAKSTRSWLLHSANFIFPEFYVHRLALNFKKKLKLVVFDGSIYEKMLIHGWPSSVRSLVNFTSFALHDCYFNFNFYFATINSYSVSMSQASLPHSKSFALKCSKFYPSSTWSFKRFFAYLSPPHFAHLRSSAQVFLSRMQSSPKLLSKTPSEGLLILLLTRPLSR